MNEPARKSLSRRLVPLLWLGLSVAGALGFARQMVSAEADKSVFLPGETTHGHYQIEMQCAACHSEEFSGNEGLQAACVRCHGEELEKVEDSHPKSKFDSPRNAERVSELDARLCVTCHSEHQPERTGTMGLSLPEDYCYRCHQDVAEERSSHKGLGFDSCASAGCHNFHDNQALYEDFLVRHAAEPPLLAKPFRPDTRPAVCPSPERKNLHSETPLTACSGCHEQESRTWQQGRHGMRVAEGLTAIRPSEARLPVKLAHADAPLSCASCHADSGKDPLMQAGVEACLACHDDEHSRSYKDSAHFRHFLEERAGNVAVGSGVTCSTCHLPRRENDSGELLVDHNQNANLRPNEKMIRSVCGDCHGVSFSIDALADPSLIKNNFQAAPTVHIESVDWAAARE